MECFEVTHVLVPYKMAKTLKNFQTKFLSKMLRMLRFISGIFLGLRMFSQKFKHIQQVSTKKFLLEGSDQVTYNQQRVREVHFGQHI